MKNLKYYSYILAAFVTLAACRPQIVTPTPTRGTADFSRYIAVGNSLTSGYSNGGLYLAGQLVSFPSIIANQMQAAGGGAFNQPLFTSAQANGTGYLTLTGFDPTTGLPILGQVTTNLAYVGQATVPGFGTVNLLAKYTADIENYGVVGIKLRDITNPLYGDVNPYFERLLPGTSPANTTTYLDFITAKPFTFFTNWLGNNDALAYATSGGAGDVLTDKSVFSTTYSTLIARLTASGQKGVVATVPDVTTVPYFTTVTVGQLLAGAKAVNPAAAAIYINAKSTTNASDNTHAARPATANDLITLTFLAANPLKLGALISTVAGPLPYGLTPLTPIEDQYVLDQNEVAITEDYVASYNQVIKSVAASKGLGVFDAFTFLTNVKQNGLVVNGVSLSSAFVSGGIFSLDGVHLTPRGYAIVANEFIKVINSQYGSTVPLTNVSSYNGVLYP